jgi:nucleotide-binding universal stress UspA family protein
MNKLAATSQPGGSVTPSAEERQSNFTELVPAVLKLKNILVPTDFSEISQTALEYAVPIAKQFGARITMLHVIEPLPYSVMTYVPMGEGFPIERIEEELNALAKRMIEPELLKEVLVRMGPAFEEITNVARDCEADLIVITTHGSTGIRHVVMPPVRYSSSANANTSSYSHCGLYEPRLAATCSAVNPNRKKFSSPASAPS